MYIAKRDLTDTQVILTYAAIFLGIRFRTASYEGYPDLIKRLRKTLIDFEYNYELGNYGSWDCIDHYVSSDDVNYMRKALKGVRINGYIAGLITGVFDYCAF